MLPVGAVIELVTVVQTVVGDAQIEFVEPPWLDDFLPSAEFREDALWTDADSTELFADAAEAGIAVALRCEQGCALALVTHHLLRQHIPAGLQTVGSRQ